MTQAIGMQEFLATGMAGKAAVLADLDGCLISGETVLAGVPELFSRFGTLLWIVSNNSSDTALSLSARLARMGLEIAPARLFLAGEQTLRRIALERPGARIALYAAAPLSAAALRRERQHAQIVFQDPYARLNPRLPVLDLITEPALIHGRVTLAGRRAMAASLLAKVGLDANDADRFAHQFSGGQRQRLCIARALSVSPDLIVADEAVSALDVSIARQITDLMAQLQRDEGLSFLFISHDIAVVERVSHRIAVMFAGQIVETGPTDLVLRNPQHPYTRRLLSAVPVPDPARRGRARPVSLSVAPPNLSLPAGQQPVANPLSEVAPGHFVALAGQGMAPFDPAALAPDAVEVRVPLHSH